MGKPFTVQFMREMPVTNKRCCSDSRVMCDRCAAAALAVYHSEDTSSESWDDDEIEVNSGVPILPMPVLDFSNERR